MASSPPIPLGSHDTYDSTTTATGSRAKSQPPLSDSWRTQPLTADESSKVARILEACRDRDYDSLARLATSDGGLVEDEVRRTAWPVLLGCNRHPSGPLIDWRALEAHREENQVQLDVDRSFVYYPKDESERQVDARKQELSHVITETLRRHPSLCYFQGYHDIVQVLLLVLGADDAVPAVARLSLLRIRDFMLPTMTGALSHLTILPAILSAADPSLYIHLSQTAPFYFALPATLTLYAHDIQEYSDIARLFDFLLANEAAMSIYLFAVIIMSRKDELMQLEADEHDMLHSILSKLPKPLDLDILIRRAADLFREYPPDRLHGWSWFSISSNSVLKTTRDPRELSRQTLQDGEAYFARHAKEIKRRETYSRQLKQLQLLARRYRRPALLTGAAVVVAVVAMLAARGHGVAAALSDHRSAVPMLKSRAFSILQRLVQ